MTVTRAEGRVEVFVDPVQSRGAVVELLCQTAPAARTDLFRQLATDLARQFAQSDAGSPGELLAQPFVDDPLRTVNDRLGEVAALLRENIQLARMARLQGVLGGYVHHDGTVGVLLQCEGAAGQEQVLKDVCMHIAAYDPGTTGALSEQPFVKDESKTVGQVLRAAGLQLVSFVRYRVSG